MKFRLRAALVAAAGVWLAAGTVSAQEAPAIDTGDTAWVLTSALLVLMMTAPGLAFFYGGLVRRKNALSTIMQSFILMGVITVQWVLFGYTIAFGPETSSAYIGTLDWLGLAGVDGTPGPYASTIPHLVFMIYQGMFAIITPALITGAFAERMKFSGFLVFSLLWATLIYDPLCHWVWGKNGWMGAMGALDFAGGTVVHISSGVSALAAALVMGKRIGYPREPMMPHNLPFAVIGAGLLWVGWFGFNAGSALGANGLAATAFVATHVAAAAASVAWVLTEWSMRGKPTALGAISGAVAGLVAITPACGFVSPMAALIIGVAGGVACFYACHLKTHLGYDDSLDVVGVHGVGGTVGAILTGVFCQTAINPAGRDGLLAGNPAQVLIQVESVLVTMVFCFVGALVLLKLVDATIGLRVRDEDEVNGLDLSQHGEAAYQL